MPKPGKPDISDQHAAALAPAQLHAPAPPDDLMESLARAGRRGRLPGFARIDNRRFRLDCDAVPFEYEILAEVEPEPESRGSRISLRTRRKPLFPAIFAVTLVITVWPGVWLTDSLLATYWGAYGQWTADMPWLTYAWYLPLTALPLPWLWASLVRKSRAMAAESAAKQRAALEAEISPPA